MASVRITNLDQLAAAIERRREALGLAPEVTECGACQAKKRRKTARQIYLREQALYSALRELKLRLTVKPQYNSNIRTKS